MSTTVSDLTHDSYIQYQRRVVVGDQCLAAAYGSGLVTTEDRETCASDAIADILTTLYGPAGYYLPTEVTTEDDVMEQAKELLARALTAYEHDNEDYIVEEGRI